MNMKSIRKRRATHGLRGFICIALMGAVCLFSVDAQSADNFLIQRGTNVIDAGSSTVTISAGADYTAPGSISNAFIRITNTRLTGAGNDTGGGTQNNEDFSVSIQNPSNLISSITFKRYGTAAQNCVIAWEIIEYTGAQGGGNEMIVRDQAEVINTAAQVTGNAVSDVADTNDIVVFITGQRHDAAGTLSDQMIHTAEWLGTQPRFTRGDGAGNAAVSYAVVEFTGTNWFVQRVEHAMSAAGPQTETIPVPVTTNRTFLHVQNRTAEQGLDDTGTETWLSSTNRVSFQVQTYVAGQVSVAWIVQNSITNADIAMKVQHIGATRGTAGSEPDIWTENVNGVRSTDSASIMGESARSTGPGTAYPRGWINLRITATNTVELFTSDNGQTQTYRYEVVQWPGTLNAAPAPPALHNVPFDNAEIPETQPTFEFTAFDPEDVARLVYEIEWDTDPKFTSPTTRTSDTHGGFTNTVAPTNTSPFVSSNKVQFTIQSGDALANSADDAAYYWRVRAQDISGDGGSGAFGQWSSVQSFRVDTSLSKAQWKQTADGQFETDTFTLTETNGSGSVRVIELGVFDTEGSDNLTIPAGVTSIVIKAWGAGGGGGGGSDPDYAGTGGHGGGGGFAQATIFVTPGDVLNIDVGGGGSGGAFGVTYSGSGGGGGGYSSVVLNGTNLVIAAGGGGGGGGDNSAGIFGGEGGAGGGIQGEDGDNSSNAGGGGGASNAVAGAAGITPGDNTGVAGSANNGGAGADGRTTNGADGNGANGGNNGGGDGGLGDASGGYAGGGGGGSGYYGGGGGGGSQQGDAGGGGGGGGSSYLIASGTDTSLTTGSGQAAGNFGDGDYAGSAGAGGDRGGPGVNGTAGGDGRIVISYESAEIVSTSIDREWAPKEAHWEQLIFDDSEGTGDIKYDIQYWDVSEWKNTIYTNIDTSPINLSTGLVVGTHDIIRLKANLIPGGNVLLNSWTLTWDDGPEIKVSGGTNEIVDGFTTISTNYNTDYGSGIVGVDSVQKTYEIANEGYVKLLMTASPTVQIIGSSDFAVTTQPLFTNLFGGGDMTFKVTYTPTAQGVATATVYMVNNDLDEDPYTFLVQGIGVVPPLVTNLAPSFVTINSARLNGTLNSGYEDSYVYVYWGTNDGGTNASSWVTNSLLGPIGDGDFYDIITGLEQSTEYFYRCFATNSAGYDWADVSTNFVTTTDTTTPTIVNLAASEIWTNSATINADLLSNGGEDSEVYIFWGTADGVTNQGTWQYSSYFGSLGPQTVATNLTGLDFGQQYFYRAFATNSVGGSWAPSTTNFTTLWLPVVNNGIGATLVQEESATLNGNLTSTSGSPTTVTIYYGFTDGETNASSWNNSVTIGERPTGAFSTNLTGLTDSRLYYYRCYAENDDGGVWADSSANFTTLSLEGATIIQTFYVPIPEDEAYSAWSDIAPSSTIGTEWRSIISIAVGISNTLVYYDHWEDDYEESAFATNQSTTQVWGDGDLSNGTAPGTTNDILTAGYVISLDNDIDVPRDANDQYYDGKDRITADKPVSVTRALFPTDQGGLMAGAVQVMDTTQYGIHYRAPIGEDINYGAPDSIFDYVGLYIMAADDPTMVDIDVDGDGVDDISTWLRQGESYHVNGGIEVGATVRAAKPVQAHLVAGQDSTYETRLFTLFPKYQWSDEYVSVVGNNGSGDPVDVWVHNPDTNNSITVFYTNTITSGSQVINAGQTWQYTIPGATAGRYWTTNGAPFIPVSTIDDGSTRDWGYGMVPRQTLTTTIVCPWGWGSEFRTGNYDPFFVTPMSNTTLYVDFDGDPNTGLLTNHLGYLYDQVISNVAAFSQVRIRDTVNNDNDQTGTRVYTLDGTHIAGAWGEDPDPSSPPGNPENALDMGTTLMPYPVVFASKSSEIYDDYNSNGLVDPGDSILFTIKVVNYSFQEANNVIVFDEVPSNTTYVAGSTRSNGVLIADETIGNPPYTIFVADEDGYNLGTIKRKQSKTLSYVLAVTNPFPDDVEIVVNSMYVETSEGQRTDIDPIRIRKKGLRIVKSTTPTEPVEPGDTLSYSIFVENTGNVAQANVQLYDLEPDWVDYVTNTTYIITASNIAHFTVADEFSTVAYTNNDGSTNWTGNWIEIGESNGADTDYVVISNSLGIGDSGRGVYRAVNGMDSDNAELSFFYRRFFADDNDEYVTIDISTNASGTNWTTLGTLYSAENDPTNGVFSSYDISSYISTNMGIRFLAGGTGWTLGSDWVYFDSVEIDFANNGSGSVTNSEDGPPILADGFVLAPGEGITATFDVIVDDPTYTSWVTNETYVISDKQLDPLYARVTNQVVKITIGDYTWLDLNGDGLQTLGEPAMSNITVNLYDDQTNLLDTTTTDTNGYYSFTGRKSGDYILEFVAPSNYYYTFQNQGDDSLDSDVDNSGFTSTFTMSKGETDNTKDAGFYQLASIGDWVWRDDNENGRQDVGETNSFAGVTVTLYDSMTNVVASTNTDSAGYYFFTNIVPGVYIVGFSEPSEYGFTQKDQGSNDAIDSDIDPSTGLSDPFQLNSAEDNTTIDAGFYAAPSTIGDFVWIDENNDGEQDATETNGISGVTVELYDDQTNLVDTTTTDSDGMYSFEDLLPGDYFINFTPPTGYDFAPQDGAGGDDTLDSDPDPATGDTITFTIGSATNDTRWDAGFYAPPSDIGDFVWIDQNEDGFQSGGTETGLVGVTVTLYNENDQVLGTDVTDTSGMYSFTNIPPGNYYIGITVPPGYILTQPNMGGTTTNSDFSKVTSQTAEFYLPPGTNYNQWDAGLVLPKGGLEITKVSDGDKTNGVAGNDVITYTITLSNTGVVTHTGVSLSDLIPTNATYVPGSITIIHPDDIEGNVADVFTTQAYTNENGAGALSWLASWEEIGETNGASAGIVQARTFETEPALVVHSATEASDGYGAWRSGDLSSEQRATLSYNYLRYFYDEEEYMKVYASSNGGASWTQIAEHEGDGSNDGDFSNSNVVDITSYISTNSAIRFLAEGMDVDEGFAVDNVYIDYGTAPGPGGPGAGPDTAASGYELDPGEMITMRLQARVNTNPTSTQLVNTVYGYSDTHPTIEADAKDKIKFCDLAVTKVVSDPFPGTNELIYFTITVTNLGPKKTKQVLLRDFWPEEITYVGHEASAGTYSSVSESWYDFGLKVDEYETLVITGRVTGLELGTKVTNYCTVYSLDTWDTDRSNNDSEDSIATAVMMGGFDAMESGGRIRVEWQTVSEIGTAGFFLYRKEPDGDYEKINKNILPGVLSSQQGGDYAFIDDTADPSKDYTYKLVEIEYKGARNDCGTVDYTGQAGVTKTGKVDERFRFGRTERTDKIRAKRQQRRMNWLRKRKEKATEKNADTETSRKSSGLGTSVPNEKWMSNAKARNLKRIGRTLYRAWDLPEKIDANLTSPVVEITLGTDGTIKKWVITTSSGQAAVDESVEQAMRSVERIKGLSSSFIQNNTTVTITFKIK